MVLSCIIMRGSKLILLAGGVLLYAVAASLLGHWLDGGSFSPRIGLTILGYETTNVTAYTTTASRERWDDSATPNLLFSKHQPSSGASVETNSSAILVRVRLRNTGSQPFEYSSTGRIPEYSCLIQRAGKWARCSYYHFTGCGFILGAGKELSFTVALPPATTAWKLEFYCSNVIPRHTAVEVLFGRGWWRLLPPPLLNFLNRGQIHAKVSDGPYPIRDNKSPFVD